MTSTQEESNEDLIKLVFDYARKNIIHMKVFFKRPYYTEIRRDLQMTTISFIGTIGGLASLCLGLSWISIVEILYHCFCSLARFAGKRFWNTVWQSKIRTLKNSSVAQFVLSNFKLRFYWDVTQTFIFEGHIKKISQLSLVRSQSSIISHHPEKPSALQ